MNSLPASSESKSRVYTVDVLAYQVCLVLGFLMLVYMAFNPGVFSGGAILYTIASVFIFVVYPAVNIFKLTGQKIIIGDDYIAWTSRDGGGGRLRFADVTRIIYTEDQMGANSINLRCYATSMSMDIPFQNFSKVDEQMVRGAILSKCPRDIVVAHLKHYKNTSSTVSYSFTGSDSMEPQQRESINERLNSVQNSSLAEGFKTLDQIESEIVSSRKGEANELYMPRKTHELEN